MRRSKLLIALFLLAPWSLTAQVLINEVMPTGHVSLADSEGNTPDLIELYNTGSSPIDISGWRLVADQRAHVIPTTFVVPAHSHRLLLCDAAPHKGVDHAGFKLKRSGGAIMLIKKDGCSIADLFTYPECPAGVSVGRMPDGATTWSYFMEPSPGTMNPTLEYGTVHARCAKPIIEQVVHSDGTTIVMSSDPDARIMFTTNGSAPSPTNGDEYTASLRMDAAASIRARAFAAGALPSEEIMFSWNPKCDMTKAIALALSPEDLHGDSVGIYDPGLFSNHTRSGNEWERDGLIRIAENDPIHVRVSISGSGSRSAGKRSFKIAADDRLERDPSFQFADGGRARAGVLRADASPHAFLRNTALEVLAKQHRLHLTTQPSVALPLHLSGDYWGLYRWMPAKNAEWLAQQCNAEAIDMVEGPAATERAGSNSTYLRALDLLSHGAPIDSLDQYFDLNSLVDLACIDLWTGRADHDLNVRSYRPREHGALWRWVLFDMDLWSLPEENSVERMCSATTLETPFVPQLMANEHLQQRLLARLTALQACALSTLGAIADSIHRANEDELAANFKRWSLELEMPSPEASLTEVKNFSNARPDHFFDHVAKHTGRKLRTITIVAPPALEGRLVMEGLELAPGVHHVRCFDGVPLRIQAKASNGHEFAGWKGFDASADTIALDPTTTHSVKVLFRNVLP
ncbi:MAG TPA: CotH kinase family protein [Flavobacteriales bacterium]|nr:CotH kinase family protein [Flavobacteriales bacterium]